MAVRNDISAFKLGVFSKGDTSSCHKYLNASELNVKSLSLTNLPYHFSSYTGTS